MNSNHLLFNKKVEEKDGFIGKGKVPAFFGGGIVRCDLVARIIDYKKAKNIQ